MSETLAAALAYQKGYDHGVKDREEYEQRIIILRQRVAAKDAEIERLRRTMTEFRDELLAACIEEATPIDALYRRCMGLVDSYGHAAEGGEG